MTTVQPTDRQLWAEAADGDGSAYGQVFDRHIRAVYNHCFRLSGSWHAAEDAAQQTFLTAWRKRDRVHLVGDSVLPWLLAVAANVVRDESRSARRWLAAVRRHPPDRDVADPADDVAGRLDDERRMRTVLDAVRRLPRAEREALQLCVWSAVSYADAAELLGIAEVSVRSRVSRARSRLATQLRPPAIPAASAPAPTPGSAAALTTVSAPALTTVSAPREETR